MTSRRQREIRFLPSRNLIYIYIYTRRAHIPYVIIRARVFENAPVCFFDHPSSTLPFVRPRNVRALFAFPARPSTLPCATLDVAHYFWSFFFFFPFTPRAVIFETRPHIYRVYVSTPVSPSPEPNRSRIREFSERTPSVFAREKLSI